MNPLIEDLQTPKDNLSDFAEVTRRVLDYLPDVVSVRKEVKGYVILSSAIAGTIKYARPINNRLFIFHAEEFKERFQKFLEILEKGHNRNHGFDADAYETMDKVVYSIQQSIGVGLDFLGNPNSARKHVGNRFEELIRLIISSLGVPNKKVVFKIPYPTDEGEKTYSCETDMVFSPFDEVKSNSKEIREREIVVSLKTSSKDRLGKIFLDKMLIQKFANHSVKVVGIFLNDIQRKEQDNINYTFVSGLFMVYTRFLTELNGVYFIDPPPKMMERPYNQYIHPFSKFILENIWKLLSP